MKSGAAGRQHQLRLHITAQTGHTFRSKLTQNLNALDRPGTDGCDWPICGKKYVRMK